MAVVPVDPPSLQDALHGPLVSRPPHVVHHLVVPLLDEGAPDARRDVVERFIPGNALPLLLAATSRAPHRIEDSLGVVDLVDGGGPLRAISAAAAGVERVPLETPDGVRLLVDVGEQPARRLAVEARGRDERVAPLDAHGPRARVELRPVVPFLGRRECL